MTLSALLDPPAFLFLRPSSPVLHPSLSFAPTFPLSVQASPVRLILHPSSFFFFSCSGAHLDLHSFPTLRSSDLRAKRSKCVTPRFSGCDFEHVVRTEAPSFSRKKLG